MKASIEEFGSPIIPELPISDRLMAQFRSDWLSMEARVALLEAKVQSLEERPTFTPPTPTAAPTASLWSRISTYLRSLFRG